MTAERSFHHRISRSRRIAGGALIAAVCVLLSACILMPGKFVSSLDLRKDGNFAFAYKGEIHFVSPSDLDEKKGEGEGDAKVPAKDGEGEAAQMNAMMGGMDLSDPKMAEEFARKLSRQHGWRSVKSMGKGRFDVDFAISGKLTHDFTFPVMEDYPLANPFVQVLLRQDGTARIIAPGFSNGPAGSPLKALAQLGAMDEANMVTGKDKGKGPKLPRLDGTFIVTTDGTIVSNSTDEGPTAIPNGSQLSWVINERTDSPPKALINLAR